MAKKYSTAFALTEDPLSESSVWAARVNLLLTNMRSGSGRAIAKAVGAGAYDDSAALLTGFATDCEITATVYKDPTLVNTATHECELLLRSAQTTSISTQYECLFSFNGNIQMFRWFSNGGAQDFELQTTLFGDESNGGEFVTGDQIRARAAGGLFTMSAIVSGVEEILGVYANTVLTTGQPGIGGYTRTLDGGDATKFAFNDAQISDIFIDQVLATDDFNRANESPLSGGGVWATPSGVNALRIVSNEVGNVTADSDSAARYTGVSAGIDHWSEITVGSTIGNTDFGAAVCAQSNGDMYLTTGFNGVELFIFSRIGGIFDQKAVVTAVYAPGDVIRLERFGDSLRLYKNSSLILTASAQTQLVGGTFGIFGFDGTYRITSWRGGKLVADYDAVPGSGGTVSTQTLTDALVAVDGFISSAIRGRNSADTLTTSDATLFGLLRQVIATDPISFNDELRYFLIRNRLYEDAFVTADGFISALTASQIITLIATSLAVFTDENLVFLLRTLSASDLFSLVDSALGSVERNVLGSDAFVTTDQGQLSLLRVRALESSIDLVDSQFNFKRLTRALASAIEMADSAVADFIDGEASLVDGSAIATGFVRRSIAIGREERKIVLGRDASVRIH